MCEKIEKKCWVLLISNSINANIKKLRCQNTLLGIIPSRASSDFVKRYLEQYYSDLTEEFKSEKIYLLDRPKRKPSSSRAIIAPYNNIPYTGRMTIDDNASKSTFFAIRIYAYKENKNSIVFYYKMPSKQNEMNQVVDWKYLEIETTKTKINGNSW